MCVKNYVGYGDGRPSDGCGHPDPEGTPMKPTSCEKKKQDGRLPGRFPHEPPCDTYPDLTWKLHANGTKFCPECQALYSALDESWRNERQAWRAKGLLESRIAVLSSRIYTQLRDNRLSAITMHGPDNHAQDKAVEITEQILAPAREFFEAMKDLDTDWEDNIRVLRGFETVDPKQIVRQIDLRNQRRTPTTEALLEVFERHQEQLTDELYAEHTHIMDEREEWSSEFYREIWQVSYQTALGDHRMDVAARSDAVLQSGKEQTQAHARWLHT